METKINADEEDKEITRASELVGDTYLSAKTIMDMNMIGTFTISEAKVLTIQQQDKPPQEKIGLKFSGVDGFVMPLNRTNTKKLQTAFGDEFKKWIGKKVEISTQKIMVGKETKDTIVLSPEPPKDQTRIN